jgi:hypothetical protein
MAVAIPAIILTQLLCWMPSKIREPPAIDPKNEVLMFFNILFIISFLIVLYQPKWILHRILYWHPEKQYLPIQIYFALPTGKTK